MADGDEDVAFTENGVAVAEFTGVFHLDRDANEILEHVFGDEAGMPAGSAGHDDEPLGVGPHGFVVVDSGHADGAVPESEAATQAIGNGFGLLVDLLEHEMLVPSFFNGLEGHLEFGDHGGDLVVLDGPDFQSGGQRNAGHFFVFEVDHIFRVLDDGGGVGGDEIFAFTDADDEGAGLAGENQLIGSGDVHDGNGVGTDDFIEGDTGGFEQVEFLAALYDLGDEVDEDFRVGVAVKGMSPGNQGLFQGVVVLNDAVVDQRELAVAAEVWVGIDVVGWAVGGPAGVPDSKVAGGHVVADVG